MNLRKDHCRNLPGRTTREPSSNRVGRRVGRRPRPSFGAPCPVAAANAVPSPNRINIHPRRGTRQGKQIEEERPSAPGHGEHPDVQPKVEHERLSATDISALASMKNVAKCDTWCELQNPVNHRVFERKLRPKRLRGGHVCLGVTQRRPEPKRPVSGDVGGGRKLVSRGDPPRLA